MLKRSANRTHPSLQVTQKAPRMTQRRKLMQIMMKIVRPRLKNKKKSLMRMMMLTKTKTNQIKLRILKNRQKSLNKSKLSLP